MEASNPGVALKSGFNECWFEQYGIHASAFQHQSILGLWNYKKIDEAISQRIRILIIIAMSS
jgi:hypothetical protein